MARRDTITKRRREPAQDRVCAVCGANAGIEGAPPFGWRTADVRPGYASAAVVDGESDSSSYWAFALIASEESPSGRMFSHDFDGVLHA